MKGTSESAKRISWSVGSRPWIAVGMFAVAVLFTTMGMLLGCNSDDSSNGKSADAPVERDPVVKRDGISGEVDERASGSGLPDRAPRGAGDAQRIVGGGLDRYPDTGWVVSLHDARGGNICTGNLVTRRFVLTAAHCTGGKRAARFEVRVGSKHYSQGGVTRRVTRIFEFPGYRPQPPSGDLALLRLDRRVRVRSVGLVRRGQHFVGSVGYIAGWGTMSDDSPAQPAWLLSASVPIQHDGYCRREGVRPFDGDVMLCAGDRVRNTCRGDSGGPLAVRVGQEWRLVGVTSWGPRCEDQPGAYAWVGSPQLRRWLRGILRT